MEEENTNQSEGGEGTVAFQSAETKPISELSADFTPGPWHVDDRRSAPLPNISVVGADNSRVAEANGVHMRDKMLRWKPEDACAADARAMANARLIAAAPALYQTLKELRPYVAERDVPTIDAAIALVEKGKEQK